MLHIAGGILLAVFILCTLGFWVKVVGSIITASLPLAIGAVISIGMKHPAPFIISAVIALVVFLKSMTVKGF